MTSVRTDHALALGRRDDEVTVREVEAERGVSVRVVETEYVHLALPPETLSSNNGN